MIYEGKARVRDKAALKGGIIEHREEKPQKNLAVGHLRNIRVLKCVS